MSKITIDPVKLVDSYIQETSWRTKENSNVSYSVGGYNGFISQSVTSAYWLDKIYSEEVAEAHKNAFIHLHDLGWLGPYCAGWSLSDLIKKGISGVKDKIYTKPAKHLSVIVNQIVNFISIMSNCWSGDTKILMANGKTVSFKELADSGITSADIMAYDPIKEDFVPAYATNIGLRKENSEMLKVYVDNGAAFFCDPYQKILVRGKGFIEAQFLEEDDVLENRDDGVNIIRVEKSSNDDSYCMNVIDLHNFVIVLENGQKIISKNCWAGAQAFSSFDTYLAPFIKADNLTRDQVHQDMQSFMFGMNFPNRVGSQPPFSNITVDLVCPEDLKNKHPIVGGVEQEFTYGDCQAEMDLLNEELFKILIEGDANGGAFQYPIVTCNIDSDFNYDSEPAKLLFKMAAKTGNPYFALYNNSDMKKEEARSMCCRLKLDLRELIRNSSGGVGGAADKTGSIGVVTLNLPRMAYLNKGNKQGLLDMIGHYMDLASESLEVKRKYCDKFMELGMYPYSKEYLGTFNNHFSTIGIVGLTECCSNFMGKDLGTPEGQELGIEILNFMRNKLSDYQEKTGHLYNLEATPAESTAYRFAKHDVEDFEDIIVSGEKPKNVYYTNSCWLPVNSEINNNIWDAIDIQEKLQPLFTGGTVFHTFLGEEIKDWTRARDFVKLVAENTKLPYITLSPKFSICQKHGLITQNPTNICPKCLEEQQKEYERKLKEIDARIEELYKNQ